MAEARIELRSDNAAGVAPEIIEAISAANHGSALAYGADDWTARLQARVREVFDAERAWVFPVLSGTAANALGLAAMTPPWGSVLCHETAHILRSEAAATSALSGGALMQGLPGPGTKLTPDGVRTLYAQTRWGDPHHSQPSVLSITCPTDHGAVYTPAEVADLAAVARERGLTLHLDGARLANAIAHLGCAPADLTGRAGVTTFSLGATKNGVMSTDAIVTFDAGVANELVYRTKRCGQVASKMRYQSVQLERYLTDGLWLRLAAHANQMMTRLYAGLTALGVVAAIAPQANLVFVELPAETIARLRELVDCYEMGQGTVRFVTSFETTAEQIDRVLALLCGCGTMAP